MAISQGSQDKLIDYAVKIALVGGGLFFINKLMKNSNTREAESQVDNSPEAQQADHLVSLLRPRNNAFEDYFTFIDKDKVIEYAKNITHLDKVEKFYYQLCNHSLVDDIRTYLSTTQRDAFYKNIASAKLPLPTFSIIANQRDEKGNAIPKGITIGFGDTALREKKFTFINGTTIGVVQKKLTLQFSNGNTSAYYVKGVNGKSKGELFYVLASQVKIK
jgi:hypothetical protein